LNLTVDEREVRLYAEVKLEEAIFEEQVDALELRSGRSGIGVLRVL
jgi:hypothetical protein